MSTKLSAQQQAILELQGDVFVTACPGSGKTRLLTEKIGHAFDLGIPPSCRVAALTYTNRAAEEIASRLPHSRRQLWTGTIHSFALEWVLRPYACYIPTLRRGFTVADEHQTRRIKESLKDDHGIAFADDVRMGFTRQGELQVQASNQRAFVNACRDALAAQRMIDFDFVLYMTYAILKERPEIAETLGGIFRLICVDEYQDTQDLQFGILSLIARASSNLARIFIVGDKNQAIYSSLGGIAKTVQEIRDEFGRPDLHHRELTWNFRSTQRIVDYSGMFCNIDGERIMSLADHASDQSFVTFANQSIHKDELAREIAELVRYHLNQGVKEEEICVLAPSWNLLTEVGRQLVLQLPDVELDAPGLSPLRYQPDSLWFKLARLFLTEPTPRRYQSRMLWATDFVRSLEVAIGRELPESVRRARSVLRCINAITSVEESGLAYLDEVFDRFFLAIELDIDQHPTLVEARQAFFDAAENRLIDSNSEFESIDSLRKMFRHPSGVVINTCHGAKGEEYSVVVCFALLQGNVPHWNRIMDRNVDDSEEAQRILYVICSRAKHHLHLFAETGRVTQKSRRPYETTEVLNGIVWDYDDRPGDTIASTES